jgi:hypothetical protein
VQVPDYGRPGVVEGATQTRERQASLVEQCAVRLGSTARPPQLRGAGETVAR